MFDELPSDPGDEDESEASSEVALERERALQALRVSVAQRWALIHQDESHRKDLESQMKSFLERVVLHYEPVSFCPPRWLCDDTPSKERSADELDSPASSSPSIPEQCFDWLFLDLDGDVWGIIQADLDEKWLSNNLTEWSMLNNFSDSSSLQHKKT